LPSITGHVALTIRRGAAGAEQDEPVAGGIGVGAGVAADGLAGDADAARGRDVVGAGAGRELATTAARRTVEGGACGGASER
jgi:hypothetical protein